MKLAPKVLLILSLTILAGFSSSLAYLQWLAPSNLSIQVTDAVTGLPVHATIALANGLEAITDAQGYARFDLNPGQTIRFFVDSLDNAYHYRSYNSTVNLTSGKVPVKVVMIPAPSIGSTCEPGGCTINSYCTEQVYIDGSTYLYRDRTGVNIGSGTNAATIIQAALDAIQGSNSPSGRVCLDYGSFPLGTTTLSINNHGMQLVGSGGQLSAARQTVLTYTGTGKAVNVYSASIRLQSVRLADFTIQAIGGATSSATAVGLTLNTVEDPTVENLVIRDFASGTGMNITVDTTSAGRYTAGGTFNNLRLHNNLNGITTISAGAGNSVNTEDFFNLKNIGTGAAGTGVNLDANTATTTFYGGDTESYATAFTVAGGDNKWFATRSEVISGTIFSLTSASLDNIVYSHTFVGGGTKWTDSGTSATNPNIILYSKGYNPAGTTISGGAFTYASPSNPAGTTSVPGVMSGLAVTFTPKFSGRAYVSVTLQGAGSAVQVTPTVGIRYGTGTAPTNGAALTGTTLGQLGIATSANANDKNTIAVSGIITGGMTVGTAYWFDLSEATNAGTSTLFAISYSIIEI